MRSSRSHLWIIRCVRWNWIVSESYGIFNSNSFVRSTLQNVGPKETNSIITGLQKLEMLRSSWWTRLSLRWEESRFACHFLDCSTRVSSSFFAVCVFQKSFDFGFMMIAQTELRNSFLIWRMPSFSSFLSSCLAVYIVLLSSGMTCYFHYRKIIPITVHCRHRVLPKTNLQDAVSQETLEIPQREISWSRCDFIRWERRQSCPKSWNRNDICDVDDHLQQEVQDVWENEKESNLWWSETWQGKELFFHSPA